LHFTRFGRIGLHLQEKLEVRQHLVGPLQSVVGHPGVVVRVRHLRVGCRCVRKCVGRGVTAEIRGGRTAGDRKTALSYLQKASELTIASESRSDDTRMRIYAYFGDREAAIPALQRLQKMPSGYYTPAMLRLDPIFDQLRADPRFEALAAENANTN
jgi:hypothetical protein